MMSDDFVQGVGEQARIYAIEALLRRRPDLRADRRGEVTVPAEEQAQFHLDELSFTSATVARLQEEMTRLVVTSRGEGASWAKIGLALGESAQTAFNRYRRFDPQNGRGAEAPSRVARRAPVRHTGTIEGRRNRTA